MIDTITWHIFLQLLIATLLGACVGIEREYKGKPAGVKTYALVSLGSALFIILGQRAFYEVGAVNTSFDPSRTLSAVIMGMGFLGGGLIIKREFEVEGLTTAAGLWIAAAIGATVGIGLSIVAVFVTLLTLFILHGFATFENRYIRRHKN
jgi:putative Mg2+ transporter-C (MgtC) family protein